MIVWSASWTSAAVFNRASCGACHILDCYHGAGALAVLELVEERQVVLLDAASLVIAVWRRAEGNALCLAPCCFLE
jgi:hypothetical protein